MSGSQWYSMTPPSGPSPDDYLAGAKRTLKKLEEADAGVLFLRDSPAVWFSVPECLARSAWQAGWRTPSSCTLRRQKSLNENTARLERQAAQDFKKVKYVDLTDYFCSEVICGPEKDGIIVYRDAHHLSVAFAVAFAPTLKDILKAENLWPRQGETHSPLAK